MKTVISCFMSPQVSQRWGGQKNFFARSARELVPPPLKSLRRLWEQVTVHSQNENDNSCGRALPQPPGHCNLPSDLLPLHSTYLLFLHICARYYDLALKFGLYVCHLWPHEHRKKHIVFHSKHWSTDRSRRLLYGDFSCSFILFTSLLRVNAFLQLACTRTTSGDDARCASKSSRRLTSQAVCNVWRPTSVNVVSFAVVQLPHKMQVVTSKADIDTEASSILTKLNRHIPKQIHATNIYDGQLQFTHKVWCHAHRH